MLKVGVCSIAWKEELPIINVLDLAAKIGFDGVEVWGRPPHICEGYDADYVKKLKRAFSETGLMPSMYGSYVRAGTENFDKEEKLAIKITKGLGTDVCRIWAGDISSADADEKKRKAIVRDLKKICEEGRKFDLIFAIERHDRTLADSLSSTVKLMEEVEAENLAVNYQAYRDFDRKSISKEIRTLGDRIVNVHCFNFRLLTSGKQYYTALEDGIIDYVKLVDELKNINFDRFIEVEFVRRGLNKKLDLETKERELRKDYEFLRKITRN